MKELMKIDFTDDQVKLIKTQIAKDCTDDELKLFLYQCKRTGLDPLTRQIYAIKRAGRMTIQCSIDGFRVIAERSGVYAGQDEPIWADDDKGMPVKCSVSVYKFSPQGQRYCAAVGVAHFKEYYPNPMNLQKSMPHVMIAKVAEALALRKAFPQDLSGLYTGDEMTQAGQESEPIDITDVPTEEERQMLRQLLWNSDLDEKDIENTLIAIDTCQTYKKYEYIEHGLQARQKPIDQIPNPSQKDINTHLRKTVKA